VRGAYALLATSAAIHGGDICFEAPFQNIGMWHGAQDHAAWTVEVERGGQFDVWLDWACADAVAGNPYVLEGGEPALRGKVAGTGGWDRYRLRKVGTLTLDKGTRRLVLRPDGPPREALLDLRGIHLLPAGTKPAVAAARAESLADARALAAQLLDDKLPAAKRQALVGEHPELAAELVAALVADLKPGTKEEYRRIPWVWRVAVAAGKRNDPVQLRRLLDVSLPKGDDPLHDWQAVVIGGGVVNGVSQAGAWPRERLAELMKDNADLQKRWRRALGQAAAMADAEKVPTGTRYDALRMIALAGWEERGGQLAKYLAKGTHPELTMGAVSGLSDIDSPKVAPLLVANLKHFSPGNRRLAVEALLRTEGRVKALLGALEKGTAERGWLTKEQVKALVGHPNKALAGRARKLFEGG
jgi:hypothetical protein